MKALVLAILFSMVASVSFANFCPEDVDNDGVVGASDGALVSGHWLQTPSHPDWLEAADVNGDGVIGGADGAAISGMWLKACSIGIGMWSSSDGRWNDFCEPAKYPLLDDSDRTLTDELGCCWWGDAFRPLRFECDDAAAVPPPGWQDPFFVPLLEPDNPNSVYQDCVAGTRPWCSDSDYTPVP